MVVVGATPLLVLRVSVYVTPRRWLSVLTSRSSLLACRSALLAGRASLLAGRAPGRGVHWYPTPIPLRPVPVPELPDPPLEPDLGWQD